MDAVNRAQHALLQSCEAVQAKDVQAEDDNGPPPTRSLVRVLFTMPPSRDKPEARGELDQAAGGSPALKCIYLRVP